ncbi:hypothetical protein [Streptomyces sp. PD-S100-1]|uniref:hypothetical protein n=1 Tax=Streptomyces sp. PD-S100-1 TaxID=3394351 RepID=UPI0039BD2348
MNQDPVDTLEALVWQRQRQRGFTERFTVGDLVRFPLGVPWNRERDYRIKTVYSDGFEVESNGLVYAHTDADAKRLGMTHSPNQV